MSRDSYFRKAKRKGPRPHEEAPGPITSEMPSVEPIADVAQRVEEERKVAGGKPPLETAAGLVAHLRDIVEDPRTEVTERIRAMKEIAGILGLMKQRGHQDVRRMTHEELLEALRGWAIPAMKDLAGLDIELVLPDGQADKPKRKRGRPRKKAVGADAAEGAAK